MYTNIFIYILDSHMAPCSACEATQSEFTEVQWFRRWLWRRLRRRFRGVVEHSESDLVFSSAQPSKVSKTRSFRAPSRTKCSKTLCLRVPSWAKFSNTVSSVAQSSKVQQINVSSSAQWFQSSRFELPAPPRVDLSTGVAFSKGLSSRFQLSGLELYTRI